MSVRDQGVSPLGVGVSSQDEGVAADAAALAPSGLSPCGSQAKPPAANAGHTPGPWFDLRPNARDGFTTIGTKGPNGPTRHIATTCWNDEQAKADARLIAAAPELLEALQGVLEGLPFAGNESEYELVQAGCTPTEAAQLSKAFTAIARATGAA